MFALNVLNNYCFSLHIFVKYLRSFVDMRPAEQALRDLKAVR